MIAKHAPWFRWYPSDWRADPRLRLCSLVARGLWIELLGYMHEAEPYGHLMVGGHAPSEAEIAILVGAPPAVTHRALAELQLHGVFSKTDSGVIYSRRMVRDREKADRDRANGRTGGNPALRLPATGNDDEADKPAVNGHLNGGVNPQHKAARAHAPASHFHIQKDTSGSNEPEAGEPAPDNLQKEIYDVGKPLLGSGGQVTKLIRQHGGDLAATMRTLRLAADKSDPREYVGAILRGERAPETDWDSEYRRMGVSL